MDSSKRLNFTVDKFGSPSPYATEHGQYVRHSDYAKLEAEAQALRGQNTKFQHMLADVVAKHFAENIKRSTAQKSMDVYLSEGIRLLEEELAALRERVAEYEDEIVDHRNYSKACREREAAKDVALVVPDRELFTKYLPGAIPQNSDEVNARKEGWNACLDELERLNGKAVSEGLLRRMLRDWEANDTVALWGDMEELQELLGEGKEHE